MSNPEDHEREQAAITAACEAGECDHPDCETFEHDPETCPTMHWNRGDDICADCGADLNPPATTHATLTVIVQETDSPWPPIYPDPLAYTVTVPVDATKPGIKRAIAKTRAAELMDRAPTDAELTQTVQGLRILFVFTGEPKQLHRFDERL